MSKLITQLNKQEFCIIGHRGAAGLAPENTLRSFEIALELSCAMIELDVHVCMNDAGKQDLVVIHDAKLNRTTNGRGAVASFTTEALKRLDAGDGQQIPLLDEVYELLSTHALKTGHSAALNIELKGLDTAASVAAFLAERPAFPVLVSSFDHAQLHVFRSIDTTTPVAPLYDRWSNKWQQTAESLSATAVNLGHSIASATRVQSILEAGYQVYVYTINTPAEAERLQKMGVNGVFTDYPDQLISLTN